MATKDIDAVVAAFRAAVNLRPTELDRWLASPESKAAGEPGPGGETKGHASGRRIVLILRTPTDELTEDDLEHMTKVVGYVKRHLAQRPRGDATDTRWRRSLMNWGHDPLRD